MKILMLKTAAGPQGVKKAGDIVEVSEKEASELFKDGAAKAAPEAPKPAAKAAPEPTAEEKAAALRAEIEKVHAKELAALKDDAARKAFIDKKVSKKAAKK